MLNTTIETFTVYIAQVTDVTARSWRSSQ